MQIILLEKVHNLGQLGDVVKVKDGFARNFLIPQGKARRATEKAIEEFKMRQRERLANLCKAAGASQPDLLADTLFLLIEGARVSRRSVGTNGPSANLVRTSRGVIASFGVPLREPLQSILEPESSAQRPQP